MQADVGTSYSESRFAYLVKSWGTIVKLSLCHKLLLFDANIKAFRCPFKRFCCQKIVSSQKKHFISSRNPKGSVGQKKTSQKLWEEHHTYTLLLPWVTRKSFRWKNKRKASMVSHICFKKVVLLWASMCHLIWPLSCLYCHNLQSERDSMLACPYSQEQREFKPITNFYEKRALFSLE